MDQFVRVLIVEDSENDAALLVRHLRRGGYDLSFERVDTAPAMRDALAKPWDLVLSDYSMPHFSGIDALLMLRSTGSEVPFIFVSGQIGEERAVAALKQGAQDYVMKDNLNRLLPAIERELRERQLRREHLDLERQVRQLEKFEAIGRLAGGIAHDFNNVIAAVQGLAQTGYQETAPGTRQQEFFQRIDAQARHAAELTAQLLAFARRPNLKRRHLSLNDVVLEAVSLLQATIGPQIGLQNDLASDLLSIDADPTQMRQILMNLCLNARDAMPHGGRLLVETRNVDIGEELRPSPAFEVSHVLLRVSDTGIGMDAATLNRMFEPFFSTKGDSGTGLGLANVYGIVKQHGGFVKATSEPGQGTTISVYLPAKAGTSQPPDAVPAPQHSGDEATILVADDHEVLRELAYEILSSLGYQVILATDGEDAVQLFKADSDKIQLVILDVTMPRLSGPQAYSQMCDIRPGLRAVFTTGHTEESAGIKTDDREHVVFLQKPYSQEALRRIVQAILPEKMSSSG